MSQPYTPSELAIRDQWNGSAVGEEELAEANAEFDRFLANVKADAWLEGWATGQCDYQMDADNPYRDGDAA